jgi:hypothetical protein
MKALITVKRGTKGLNVRPRCIGTAWSLPFGAILYILVHLLVLIFSVVSSSSSSNVSGEFLLVWEDGSDMFGQFRTVSYTLIIVYKSENSRAQPAVCSVVRDTTIQRGKLS